ncbi:glycoside hydrolase family 2 TIM barrel-domain containing protein [Mangrovimonas sp. DI 80]|uniref:glycoside hydrolase family 2 TIM barrel-domain containing protein n=1 Tax=Mangrovimonas sp. DI 80 TaxID=1779330 RepID=UPI000F506515|nr:glycoside hydrolase family 2 TIM barrel-domain containing protein [Mangrovimonas sp. DI 80]
MLIPIKNNIVLFLVFLIGISVEILGQTKTINSGWQYSEDKVEWQSVNIPHTWNLEDAFDDQPGYRRGLGCYKKQVFIASEEKEKIHYLKFNAVNQEATVYVNGKIVGNHKGGYTAFSFNITSLINFDAYNLIEVVVDNSHNENIPPLDADFTFYGGIYRDVELITLPKQHFSVTDFASDGFYVNYYDVSKEKGGIEVTAILENLATAKTQIQLKLELLDSEGANVKSRIESLKLHSGTSNEFKIKLPEIYNPKLWSPETPYLYRLKLTLLDEQENVLDYKWTNVGFRWVSVDSEKGFFLNGKPIKLIGVNRHQDYKGYGNAVPIELQKKDIELIKNMGANVIRFAHYPHSRELYDMCDKLGILVWTEIPIVNKVTDSKAFFETSITMQKEHIKQYYNFPSVVMFGYMNEIFLRLAFDGKSSEEEKNQLKKVTLDLAQQLENLTRDMAPNHLTVMACHLNEVYNETGIADLPMILGWNLYFGWYDAEIEGLGTFLDDQQRRFPKRSMLLSEYGPGADVRIYTRTPKKFDFSTDYQLKLNQSYVQQIKERPFMTGMTAWNFADFGSEFRGDAIPHVNQKGLVQYDRTPKDIYYWYKSVLDDAEPFLHIAASNLSGLTLIGENTYPVKIFGNQSSATVYLNDRKLKDIVFMDGVAEVEMPFVNGTNCIMVVSGNREEVECIEVVKASSLNFEGFDRFGINLGAHFFFTDEAQQITFVPDQEYVNGEYGYVDGKAYGMTKDKNQGMPHNIRNTTSEPLFQTMLEGCSSYKVDLPNGNYRVKLFFVEPQIKPSENIYNLSQSRKETQKQQRVFDVYLNGQLIEKRVNMAQAYPEKYGITMTSTLEINNNQGLTVSLKPVEGTPVISGLLIEKLN